MKFAPVFALLLSLFASGSAAAAVAPVASADNRDRTPSWIEDIEQDPIKKTIMAKQIQTLAYFAERPDRVGDLMAYLNNKVARRLVDTLKPSDF